MKIDVAIPVSIVSCRNMDFMNSLLNQTKLPDNIFIVDNDGLIDEVFERTTILKGVQNRRGKSRNIAIDAFLNNGSDALIFIDQDCVPMSDNFIKCHNEMLQDYDLVYGMRMQKLVNSVKSFSLCVLQNNLGKNTDDLNLDDLRKCKQFTKIYNQMVDPYDKALYAINETLCWSCNFSGRRELFEKGARFDNDRIGWGYEDIMFSIDCFFKYGASCIFDERDETYVEHVMHNTSPEDNQLFHSIERAKMCKYMIEVINHHYRKDV